MLFIALLISAATGFLLRDVLLAKALAYGVSASKDVLARKGVSRLDFASARLLSSRAVEVDGLAAEVSSPARWTLGTRTLRAELLDGRLELSSDGLAVDAQSQGQFQGSVKLALPFDARSPRDFLDSMRKSYREARAIVRKGAGPLAYDVAGTLRFEVKGSSYSARVFVEKGPDVTTLLMDPQDVRAVAAGLRECLSDDEIRVLSRHPIQAPRMYQIRNFARETAASAAAADKKVPQGSYRHILWNYRLAKELGAPLAKEQTDAHETGNCEPDEKGDVHEMDLHNNALGREYAKAGVPESDLIARLLADPRVRLKWQ